MTQNTDNPADEIVRNARTCTGPCEGCPATTDTRPDGEPRSEGINPGLGHYDAEVMFVTIDPSPAHGKIIDWDAYDWEGYNDRYYDRLLHSWDSGHAIREIIAPVDGITTDDVWVADSIKCPPRTGEDDQARSKEFAHCRRYLEQEIEEVDPRVIVALGNKPASRTLEVLDGPSVHMGAASHAGRRFETGPQLLISTSWSHGWLFDRSPNRYWGGDWVESQSELQDKPWNSYLEIVQTSLEAAL
ncbi:uracil-DNA glycosylase family protein [Natrialbaceae archaeon A-arb3/5]